MLDVSGQVSGPAQLLVTDFISDMILWHMMYLEQGLPRQVGNNAAVAPDSVSRRVL